MLENQSPTIKLVDSEKSLSEPEENSPIEIIESETMRLIKQKLEEYRLQYPESRIFKENLEDLGAVEFKSGYFIGECRDESQRHGYGI